MSSLENVEGIFCLGRRGWKISDGGSDLDVLFLRVGELNVPQGIGYAEIWGGSVSNGCELATIDAAVIFWH